MNGREMTPFTNLGTAYYFAPGQRQLAAAQFTNALAIGDSDLKVNPRDADAHILSAYCYAMLGRRTEALDHLQTALLLRPNDAEVLYFAAVTNAQLGNDQQALSWLSRAVSRGYSRAEIERTLEFDRIKILPEFQQLAEKN
jgi:tetratricopeptide (TPR) repeat protein